MGTSILLVDPAVSFAQFVTLVLTRLGHSGVIHAASAETALTLATEREPHLIFSEIRLPGMSGLELCAAFRHRGGCPFVFLTTDGSAAMRRAAASAGGSEYLTKPVNSRTLHEVTERLLPFSTQRHHLRTTLVLEAGVFQGDRDVTLRTLSVGEGGLFLETPQPASVGTPLRIRLPLPGLGGPLHLTGEVVHASPGGGVEPPGMGVKFVGLDENTRIFLRHYLETYAAGGAPFAPAEA